MKSDNTISRAGYAAVFGFNLGQLTCYLIDKIRPKYIKLLENKIKSDILDNTITNPLAA
ncbi:transposase IS4 [Legionella beliardensis]|uniref:Transposase IS4 n=1 Tax=Legionella beliardensis TaxID=91822 RepID=A0A378JT02_9GAMM|nr:transposase IS4 [Legionella beliardensis]